MSDSSQTEENSQKRKSDIPVAVVKPIEKKKRRTKNCLLCSVHGIDVAVNNHSRYCKYMQDITSGVHWCVKCNYVFQRRINMAILTQQKRNRDKDNEKLNGRLDKDEVQSNLTINILINIKQQQFLITTIDIFLIKFLDISGCKETGRIIRMSNLLQNDRQGRSTQCMNKTRD